MARFSSSYRRSLILESHACWFLVPFIGDSRFLYPHLWFGLPLVYGLFSFSWSFFHLHLVVPQVSIVLGIFCPKYFLLFFLQQSLVYQILVLLAIIFSLETRNKSCQENFLVFLISGLLFSSHLIYVYALNVQKILSPLLSIKSLHLNMLWELM